jgi:hypothetical protein
MIAQQSGQHQGCQMVYFQTKSSNLGKFCRALDWKNVDIFLDHLDYCTKFGIFGTFCVHLVHFLSVLISHTKKNLATLVNIENKRKS